jgi:hypothetical protein
MICYLVLQNPSMICAQNRSLLPREKTISARTLISLGSFLRNIQSLRLFRHYPPLLSSPLLNSPESKPASLPFLSYTLSLLTSLWTSNPHKVKAHSYACKCITQLIHRHASHARAPRQRTPSRLTYMTPE